VIFLLILDPAILAENYGLRSTEQMDESFAAGLIDAAMEKAARAGVTASSKILTGKAAQGIIHLARAEKASAIVMGTHGRTGIERALLRSVAEETLRQTDTPVCVMRTPPNEKVYGRLLVPIANNELERAAGRYAVNLAREFESSLLFCTVGSADEALLDEAKRFASDNGVRSDAILLDAANVANAILQSAATHEIDAIVMATHGRKGFMRMVDGSVTESVVRATMNPIVVIRPH
jgi:nucleotide-binding universal stress UspA family protein